MACSAQVQDLTWLLHLALRPQVRGQRLLPHQPGAHTTRAEAPAQATPQESEDGAKLGSSTVIVESCTALDRIVPAVGAMQNRILVLGAVQTAV